MVSYCGLILPVCLCRAIQWNVILGVSVNQTASLVCMCTKDIWLWHDHSLHQDKYDLYFIASPISQNYLQFRSWLRGAQCACTHGPGAPKIMEDIRCQRNKQKCITMWIKHFKRFWGMHLLHLGGCTASWTIKQGKHEARQPNTQAGSFNNTHHSLPGKTAHIWERLQQHRPAPKQ